jgi:NADH-quinone oxidoreductase subunit K
MHVLYPALVSALLFSIGIYGVLVRRNAILVLMSVELMLNAANLDLVAFDVWLRDALHSGQALTLFVVTLAAAEIGLGLAIVLLVYRSRATIAIDELVELGETSDAPVGEPR